MSKKKNKFDLTHLVHNGQLKDGQKIFFVSDPSKYCAVTKQPNGEYKVVPSFGAFVGKVTTVHAFAQECLGTEPPDHAAKWFRTDEGNGKGKTLFELWHAEDDYAAAA